MFESKIKATRPGGFRDFLPADYLAREKIIKNIEKTFRNFGFSPIETPEVEFLQTLSGEESETGKNIFKIQSDKQGEKLGLRFDLTVPLARILAANPYNSKSQTGLRLPWKRMAKGVVFRGETPQSGRYRQFYQIDADIAGTSSLLADAEIIKLMEQTLTDLNLKKFVIKLNNRKILNGLAETLKISDRGKIKKEEIKKEIFRILDKIDKIGKEKVIKELEAKPDKKNPTAPNLDKNTTAKIKKYLSLKGNNWDKLKKAGEIFKGAKEAQEGIKELKEILDCLKNLKIDEKKIQIDFSIVRGLDYYTGPVMEAVLTDAPQFGSVFSGGRYDNLVSKFTGQNIPVVGSSIGVDRLFAALEYLGLVDKEQKTITEVMVLRLAPDQDKKYLEITQELREVGINTELSFLEDTTFKSQFNYALNQGVKYVLICGEEEFKKDTIQIKNLKTRKQTEVKRKELKKYFSK